MKDSNCFTSLGEGSSALAAILGLDALGRRSRTIGFRHETEANLCKFTPYNNIDGFDIISIKRVEEFIHDFPLQQNYATFNLLISFKLKNSCKKDHFSNFRILYEYENDLPVCLKTLSILTVSKSSSSSLRMSL